MANFNNWADGSRIGNYFAGASGYGSTESEEERRRREYEEAYGRPAPVATGAGSSMIPAANTMVVPPTPMAPVAPQQIQERPPIQPYSGQGLDPRQVQMESGGRDFGPNGQPLTSPAGAMFRNQVMPATAQNPGFGIRPAAAQTPEEYNRVGNEYMDAMRKRYGGNEQAALAAYNAGPGTVDKNLASNQGQLNVGTLPAETQNYVNKLAPVNPSQPAPQTQPQPTTQTQPAQQDQGYYDQKWYDTFTAAQENPLAMAALANNPTVPAGIRQAANAQQYSALQISQAQQQAQKQVQEAVQDPNAITRILKEKNEEGSWAKAVLFSMLGSKSLAESEYTKLGKGAVWQNTTDADGKPVLAQIRADGLPMRGYDITTGAELDAKQLASVAGGYGGLGKGIQTGQTLYEMSDKGTATLGNDSRWYRNGRPLPPNITPVKEFKEGVNQRKQTFNEAIKQVGKWYDVDPSQITPQAVQSLITRLTPPGGDRNQTIQMIRDNAIENGARPEVVNQFVTQSTAPQQTQPTGAVAPTATTQPTTPAIAPVAPGAPTIAGAKSNIAVNEEARKHYQTKELPEITKDAADAKSVKRGGQEIMDIVMNRPEIAGFMNNPGVNNILIKIAAGQYKDSEGGPQEMENQLRTLGLNQNDPVYVDMMRIANIQKTAVLPKQLRKVVGPGPVALPEQDMNKAAGIDPTQQPLYAGLSGISRRNLDSAIIEQAANFANNATTLAEVNKFKSQQEAQIFADRAKILEARRDYLKKYGYSKEAQLQVMKEYPDPVLDEATNQFVYSNGSKAVVDKLKRPPLSSFVR